MKFTLLVQMAATRSMSAIIQLAITGQAGKLQLRINNISGYIGLLSRTHVFSLVGRTREIAFPVVPATLLQDPESIPSQRSR